MDDPVLVNDLRSSKPPPGSVYDDMFESYFNGAAEAPEPSPKASSSSSTPPPVFDKPVFDDDPDALDPFDAIPLFGAGGGGDDREEDFLGGLGRAEKSEEKRKPKVDKLFPGLGGSARSMEPVRDAVESDYLIPGLGGSAKPSPPVEPEEVVLDDGVIPGFGGSTNHHHSARDDDPMSRQEREPISSSKMSVSMPEDPFVILGATPKSEYSSFGLFSDYLDNIAMPAKSENTKVDAPANSSGRFQGSDMFAGFPKAMPSFSFVSEKESDTTGRRSVNCINSMSQSNHMPVQQGSAEATANILPEVPIVTGFQTLNPFAMDDGLPEKNGYSKMPDDVWLTVSDITLVTQPTSAPPPSRPPPPLVTKQPPTESVTTKTYPHHHNQGYHHSVGSTVTLKSSQINELEDFFMPKSAKFANGRPRVLNHEGTEQYSSTGTANFMGQSEEMDQGDFGSVFSSSRYRQEEIDEKSEFCAHEMEKMDEEELLENERRQREHDEEQRRAERERIEVLEQEREKVRQREQEEQKRREKEREARQAVEKAIREARERAAVEACLRAESEARQRAERAAVQKAAAEARERAAMEARERAVKSAAEAKERATADARERDARAAAEAREKEAAESQDKATAEAQAKAERGAVVDAAAEAVEKAIREARERAAVEARMRAESEARRRAERAAVQKATAEARARAAVEARERAAKSAAEAKERATEEARERAARAAAEAREKAAAESQEKAAAEAQAKAERAAVEKATAEARRRAERAAFERVAAEARQRAANEARERAAAEVRARENQQKTATAQPDLESFFGMPSGSSSVPRSQTATTNPFDVHPQGSSGSGTARTTSSGSASPFMQHSSSNLMDDLSSILGGGEREERRKPGLEREQKIMERAAKALAEKNERDLQAQQEQEERHRIGETIDFEIKRWAAGKEGNIRAMLSTLQYILWPESGWRPVSLTDLMAAASVKKEYRRATLCIHPDKVQQKGANLQQRYIAEKVFDLLKEAWNKFNSEELF